MRHGSIAAAALASGLAASSLAGVSEDFESGLVGFESTWANTNSVGSYDITADPLRAGNSVLRASGSASAHQTFTRDASLSSQDFELTFEYLSFTDDRGPLVFLGAGDGGVGIRLTNLDSWLILDTDQSANGPDWGIADPDGVGAWPLPTGAWLEVSLSHNSSLGLFTASISDVDTGDIIYERTLVPELWNGYSIDIDRVLIGVEETSTQYLDNVRVETIPAPGSALALLVLGTAAHRRRMKCD